jgi:transcriptional regulator with XRE-family HTH domain
VNDGHAHDHELGKFLRARRERLRPADVGLPASSRRRTPGLRREEVAVLAGVSVEYLTRLEQGRDLKPSGAVVHALAQALRLSDDERTYVATLSMAGSARELCPTATTMVERVAPNVQAIIDALEPMPAFLVGPASYVLAGNDAWRTLVEPLGILDDERPNLAAWVFTEPRSRTVLSEWARVADEQVSQLRAASLRWGQDPAFAVLLERLGAEPEFARRWSAHSITEFHRGMTLLRHPEVGELRLRFETLQLPNDGDQRLTTWHPADEASEAALRVATRVGPLRVVRPA